MQLVPGLRIAVNFILAMTLMAGSSFCDGLSASFILLPKDAHHEGVDIAPDGSAALSAGNTQGVCTWDLASDKSEKPSSLKASSSIQEATDLNPRGDVILQFRWREKRQKNWPLWQPENILPGGDFKDENRNGLPDFADVLEFGQLNRILTDLPNTRIPHWFKERKANAEPSLLREMNGRRVLAYRKGEETGQTIIQMRTDRVPIGGPLTVSGWNGWDLGSRRTMGLMSRFHEIDKDGNRINKIMFIGDDDWHQPGGREPLKWRAVSFSPKPKTVRLNLYAGRLISASGELEIADYQLRADGLDDPRYKGKVFAAFALNELSGWTIAEPALVKAETDCVVICPKPHSNSYIVSPEFSLPEVERIAFSVEMDVKVPERYNDCDPSHKAWASTYMELLGDSGDVLDVVKISVCRPQFGGVLLSAGQRPAGAHRARLRLVGSHESYLDASQKANMDGEMVCRWRNMCVFESKYPTAYQPRLDGELFIPWDTIPAHSLIQVRALILGDSQKDSPRLFSLGACN